MTRQGWDVEWVGAQGSVCLCLSRKNTVTVCRSTSSSSQVIFPAIGFALLLGDGNLSVSVSVSVWGCLAWSGLVWSGLVWYRYIEQPLSELLLLPMTMTMLMDVDDDDCGGGGGVCGGVVCVCSVGFGGEVTTSTSEKKVPPPEKGATAGRMTPAGWARMLEAPPSWRCEQLTPESSSWFLAPICFVFYQLPRLIVSPIAAPYGHTENLSLAAAAAAPSEIITPSPIPSRRDAQGGNRKPKTENSNRKKTGDVFSPESRQDATSSELARCGRGAGSRGCLGWGG